jgi:hypothetical protein
MAKKAAAKKTASARSSSSKKRDDGPKGPALDTSNGTDAAVDKQAEQDEQDRRKAAHTTLPPLPVVPNPPPQPAMIPAKQIEGASSQALDPDDLPANRRSNAGTIRVQAKAIGYYDDVIRRVGDVFDIADEKAFSDKWMRRVPTSTPERVTGSNAALERNKKGEPVNEPAPEPRGAGQDVLGD